MEHIITMSVIYAPTERSVAVNMKCVKSTELYSPQAFVEALTGKCYCFNQDNTVEEIHRLLKINGVENDTDKTLWDYSLDEIDEIVENNVPVVLVDTTYINEDCEMVYEYRWFEVPESFRKE